MDHINAVFNTTTEPHWVIVAKLPLISEGTLIAPQNAPPNIVAPHFGGKCPSEEVKPRNFRARFTRPGIIFSNKIEIKSWNYLIRDMYFFTWSFLAEFWHFIVCEMALYWFICSRGTTTKANIKLSGLCLKSSNLLICQS